MSPVSYKIVQIRYRTEGWATQNYYYYLDITNTLVL